jgi:hypothetical protein
MLFSLPDNDHYSHRHGPTASSTSIAHADECLGAIVDAAGGVDAFLVDNAVILMADHSQTEVESELDLGGLLKDDWHVLQPNAEDPHRAELAVGPSSRAAGVWVLRDEARGRRLHDGVRATLSRHPGVDLLTWLADADGRPAQRRSVGVPDCRWAVVAREGQELRFAPGRTATDRRGDGWSWDGDLELLGLERSGGVVDSARYPDAFARLWAALRSPYAADLLISAAPGYELVDWGGTTHIPGGSHGSLLAGDSLGPLLTVGLEGEQRRRDQWAISDVAGLARGHFGLTPPSRRRRRRQTALR